jgi:hypothetical protein
MKRSLTQFQATPEELIDFLCCLRGQLSFSLAIIGWKPFALTLINKSDDFDFAKLADVENKFSMRIALSCREPLVAADSEGLFYDNNPGCVTIDIGKYSEDGLDESALSFGSSDDDSIVFAKKVFSKLKKITTAGAVAVNPDTGAEGWIRTHRYTQGAKDLFDRGVKMKSLGSCIYKFGS